MPNITTANKVEREGIIQDGAGAEMKKKKKRVVYIYTQRLQRWIHLYNIL